MSRLAARARGLTTRVASADALAALDRAADPTALAAALALAGITAPMPTADAIEQLARDRVAFDLAILARWSDARSDELAVLALDEDRRSLRAIVRGIAGAAPVARRLAGTVPTVTLPAAVLAELARAGSPAELADRLARRGHPLAIACAVAADAHRDPLEIELALARGFVAHARASWRNAGRAEAVYLGQLIDAEHTASALLIAARGGGLTADRAWLGDGELVDRATFAAACGGSIDDARVRLAAALRETPLAGAVFAAAPAALEDAALAWQLAAQMRLRRQQPEGLAPVLCLVLLRRREARRLRGAAWRVALGGAP